MNLTCSIPSKFSRVFFSLLIMTLFVSACGNLAADGSQSGVANQAVSTTQASPATQTPRVRAENALVINQTGPCQVVTQTQVEEVFGKSVTSVLLKNSGNVVGCVYKFVEFGAIFEVNLYNRPIDKQQFAAHVAAFQQSCQDARNSFLKVYNPLSPPRPSTKVQELMTKNSLGQLYLQDIAAHGDCWFSVGSQDAQAGSNVYTREEISQLGGETWSSTVAVVNNEQVVEFQYSEPLPKDLSQQLSTATDKNNFNVLAESQRLQVLTGYTQLLLKLVQQSGG